MNLFDGQLCSLLEYIFAKVVKREMFTENITVERIVSEKAAATTNKQINAINAVFTGLHLERTQQGGGELDFIFYTAESKL